jgi:chromosome segregation ATPase
MNPLIALSEQFQKLIIEKGGAAITRDNLTFLRDQICALEKNNANLKSNIETLESDKKNLESNLNDLKGQLKEQKTLKDNLQKEIEHLKSPKKYSEPIVAKNDFNVFKQ